MRFGDRSYLLLHAAFSPVVFTSPFGDPFTGRSGPLWLAGFGGELVTGDHRTCQYCRKFIAGWLLGRFRGKDVLFWMYGSRTMLIFLYLACPKWS